MSGYRPTTERGVIVTETEGLDNIRLLGSIVSIKELRSASANPLTGQITLGLGEAKQIMDTLHRNGFRLMQYTSAEGTNTE